MQNEKTILASDMSVGDIIRMRYQDGSSAKYSDSTVDRIDDTLVYLKRPYIYFDSDTSIAYIGLETFEIYRISSREHIRVE